MFIRLEIICKPIYTLMGQKILKIPEDPINSSNDMNQFHGIYFNDIDLSHFIKVF